MAEIPVNIDGLDEKWQDWILLGVKNEKDEFNDLPGAMKPIIRSLARRPVALTTPEKLVEYYDQLENLTRDKENNVTDADIAPYLLKITNKVQLFKDQFSEKRAVVRELPLHIGAVFKNGRNELLVEHESIPILDIKREEDRERYILENIHAFDELLGQPLAWKGAVDIWIADAKIAAQAEKLDDETFDKFTRELKCAMAITASARAMEFSGGDLSAYLTIITNGEKGPDSGKQDDWADYLLHADPAKLIEMTKNSKVKKYFDILMKDALLVNDDAHKWREVQDPEDLNKKIWLASKVELSSGITKERIQRGKLVEYLKDFGEKGGFAKYISEVLLAGDEGSKGKEHDSKWAAARIACDIFLVDSYTRWEDFITDGGKIKLNLQPSSSWGGDPLGCVNRPSTLPRIKGVYTGKDQVILDLMDKTFRPVDIFKDSLEKHLLQPSMAYNLKKLNRYATAINDFINKSPMAEGIPLWDDKTMRESLPDVASMLEQVYGTIREKRVDGSNFEVGRHIVGEMMMRVLYTKALATTIESAKPGFAEKIEIIFDPQNRNRPFLEVMTFLYGSKLDSKSGFLQSLVGGRTRLVIKYNIYGAEDLYKKLWNILQTNDQSGGKYARTLNTIGLAFDVLAAFSKRK